MTIAHNYIRGVWNKKIKKYKIIQYKKILKLTYEIVIEIVVARPVIIVKCSLPIHSLQSKSDIFVYTTH